MEMVVLALINQCLMKSEVFEDAVLHPGLEIQFHDQDQ